MNYPVSHPIRPLNRLQIRQLMADLNQARVASRRQGSSTLSYIEAWDARRSAIRIFGFGGFSTRIVNVRTIHQAQDAPAMDYQTKKQKVDADGNKVWNWRVAVEATVEVYIHQLGAIYSDSGVASQVGPDIGEVADFATKTATSDTFKRCMINLGTQFGLSLYDDGSLSDVVRQVLATGQRMLEVDFDAIEQTQTDSKMREAIAEAAPAKEAPAAPAQQEQPDAPSDTALAAAANTLAGGFGAPAQ